MPHGTLHNCLTWHWNCSFLSHLHEGLLHPSHLTRRHYLSICSSVCHQMVTAIEHSLYAVSLLIFLSHVAPFLPASNSLPTMPSHGRTCRSLTWGFSFAKCSSCPSYNSSVPGMSPHCLTCLLPHVCCVVHPLCRAAWQPCRRGDELSAASDPSDPLS